LAAPLDPGGTLAALGRRLGPRARELLAKSGTTTTEQGVPRDRWVIAAERSAEARAWLLMIGAPRADRPVGRGLGTAALIPLLELLNRSTIHMTSTS
jgi:hypothetical protein